MGGECSDLGQVGSDNGFAFGYTALPEELRADKDKWLGWEEAKFHSMHFLEGGDLDDFCHTGIAQGKLTLTSRWKNADGKPIHATVDKTFSYFVGECSDLGQVGSDNGFAFGYTALPEELRADKDEWLGWEEATARAPLAFPKSAP